MINSLSIIIVLAIVGLTIPVMNVNAGDRNCDVDVNHPYCTGEEGASGMVYCDLAYSNPADVDMYGDCYNRDFSTIDCHEHPNHSRCIGFEGREGKINTLGTRKRYYERLSKIRKAHLIIKKKDRSKGDDISNYELTDLGSSLYESLLTLRRAANLRWRLNAIDVLDDRVPIEERIKLIQAIIPDETIRKILLKH